jgi:hypothetical protein
MKLRQLFESRNSVAIIFGRFNPPHKGHKAAWQIASKHPHWYVGTNQSTQGPKDPLPFDVKVEAMKAIWPEVEEHIVAEQSWLTLASKVYQDHGEVTLFCLTDEDWVTKTIQQYNGKEGTHGFYNFPSIKQQATPRLSSATALRDAVIKGDREAFSHAAGVSADTDIAGHPFFDVVAHYLMPYQNAPKKVAKKKTEKEVGEGLGEIVPLAMFLGMVYAWYKHTKTKGPSFKVFINGKDVSDKVLTKAEAVHVIKNLAKQEHDTKTQYTIVDTNTNNIVFRRTWSDVENDHQGRGWVDSNEESMAPPSAPNFSTDGGHHTLETKRMSAQVKLQRAWDRERAKSDASRERMRRELELIAGKHKPEEPKKDEQD